MNSKMDWTKLLTTACQDGTLPSPGQCFREDFNYLQSTPEFRALGGKTQVFSMAPPEVRNRLTHTLEVSNTGRELGSLVGKVLVARYNLHNIHYEQIAQLVAAACLAHDLGHPPMAHSGESAIRQWMATSKIAKRFAEHMTECEQLEVLHYEGNAQNYRLVQSKPRKLSYACLATFSKYLRPATYTPPAELKDFVGFKKYGYFQSEAGLIADMAEAVGLLQVAPGVWHRHPLAYLLEAADDISYRLADMEDFYFMNTGDRSEMLDLLNAVAGPSLRIAPNSTPQSRVEQMRLAATNRIIKEAVDVFLQHEGDMCAGTFKHDILDHIPHSKEMNDLTIFAKKNVYVHETINSTRLKGFTMLETILNFYGSSLFDIWESRQVGRRPLERSTMAVRMIPEKYYAGRTLESLDVSELMHLLLDYVGGMTDFQAVDSFRYVRGDD